MTDSPEIIPPPRDYWPTAGWRSADPSAHGMDAVRLAAAWDHLASQHPHLNSLLVVRGGYVVFEDYRDGAGPYRIAPVMSVTKSVVGALIGVALHTGDLLAIDEPLAYLLPAEFSGVDDRDKRAITLAHLLTMRSGLDWAEWGGTTQQMMASQDWVQFVLDQPLAHAPGTVFNYSTGDTHLLAAALHAATGMTPLDYADLYLFRPLGITRRAWNTDPQGLHVGGAGLALSPHDLALYGYLILNGGVWDGDALLPPGWARSSLTAHANVIPAGEADCQRLDYGYLFWLRDQGAYASGMAVGYGGQYVYILPALDLVVVVTGSVRDVPDAFRDTRLMCAFNLVQDFVVPAVNA
jgi:CubicO group peptidase (beta-lactamase class C family)